MRIFHTEWSQGWGGQEIRILAEMEALRERDFEMAIACHPESSIFRESKERNLTCFPVEFGSPANLRTILKVARLAKDFGAEIIHTHSSKDSWIGGFAGKIAGIPVVRSRHISAVIKQKPTNKILYGFLPKAIITSGKIIADQLIEATGVPWEKVFPVAPGADPNRFQPNAGYRKEIREEFSIPGDALVFGMVAVLRSWKGHCLFLEAIAPLMKDDPSVWVMIVGEGPYRKQIEKTIESFSLKTRSVMTGYRTDTEKIFPALDVHLLPSLKDEGAPQAVPQAMMSGVVNITSDGGGLPEVVDHEVTGLVSKAGDLDSLRVSVEQLAKDPELRASLGKAGQKKALESFTFERQIDDTVEAYRYALSN